MPTSNLRPLEIPSGPRASHQFLQERMRLPGYDSQDHCMASPSSILRATEVCNPYTFNRRRSDGRS